MGLTQVQLAAKLKVNPRTIMRYENGHVLIPSERVEKILALARKRGVAA